MAVYAADTITLVRVNDGTDGADGSDGVSVESITAYYATSKSSTYYPTHGTETAAIVGSMIVGTAVVGNSGTWYTEMPELEDDDYLWVCYLVEYSNGASAWTEPYCMTDASVREQLSEVIEENADIVNTLSSINLYVSKLKDTVYANYEEVSYQITEINLSLDGITSRVADTETKITDLEGEAITNSETEYYLSSSASSLAGGSWTTSAPTWTEGTYVWIRTTFTYGTGDSAVTYTTDPVCITGNTGATGTDGKDGVDGADGDDGVSVDSITAYYAVSGSSAYYPTHDDTTAAIVGSMIVGTAVVGNGGSAAWTTDLPEVGDDEYLWECFLVAYSSGDTAWTEPCLMTDAALRGEMTTLKEQYSEIEQTNSMLDFRVTKLTSTVADNYSELSEAYSEIKLLVNSISLNITGALGGTASIVMTVGDTETEQEIDLTGIRKAFAAEDSAIAISAGTVAFNSNTLIVNSDNLTITADGKIVAVDGEFSGTITAAAGSTFGPWTIASTAIYRTSSAYGNSSGMYFGTSGLSITDKFMVSSSGALTANGTLTTESGSYKTVISGGRIAAYYDSEETAVFTHVVSSAARQFAILGQPTRDGIALGETTSSGAVYTYYRMNTNDGYTNEGYRHAFNGTVLMTDNVKLSGTLAVSEITTALTLDSALYTKGVIYASKELYFDGGVGNERIYFAASNSYIRSSGSESDGYALGIGNGYGGIVAFGWSSSTSTRFYYDVRVDGAVTLKDTLSVSGILTSGNYINLNGGSSSKEYIYFATANSFIRTAGSSSAGYSLNIGNGYGAIAAFGYSSGTSTKFYYDVTVDGTFTNSSDARLKQNITALAEDERYDVLFDNLHAVTYEYKKNAGKKHPGFTTQGVLEAMEKAGLTRDDFAAVADVPGEDGEIYGALSYTDIIALLVQQVQSLKSRIDRLERSRA